MVAPVITQKKIVWFVTAHRLLPPYCYTEERVLFPHRKLRRSQTETDDVPFVEARKLLKHQPDNPRHRPYFVNKNRYYRLTVLPANATIPV